MTVARLHDLASALPRRISATSSGMWLCSNMWLANSCGSWPDCWARSTMCSVSSFWSTPSSSLLGDLVEDELRGDGVADAALEVGLELLLGLALVLEVLLQGHAGEVELLLDAARGAR